VSKPRPVLILQDDRFDNPDSITVCGITTDPRDAPLIRFPATPNPDNGLRSASRIMVNKITTVDRRKLGVLVGRLDASDLVRVNQAMLVFLGLATTSR
jgi:mRNA interferase MazF